MLVLVTVFGQLVNNRRVKSLHHPVSLWPKRGSAGLVDAKQTAALLKDPRLKLSSLVRVQFPWDSVAREHLLHEELSHGLCFVVR